MTNLKFKVTFFFFFFFFSRTSEANVIIDTCTFHRQEAHYAYIGNQWSQQIIKPGHEQRLHLINY
jgi:hypothetical protein